MSHDDFQVRQEQLKHIVSKVDGGALLLPASERSSYSV